ncbi:MAG: hypothetical protein GQ561_03620 [Calditrichae bacterium]|nr:hypothetical protein [Calditrichia bacterium]
MFLVHLIPAMFMAIEATKNLKIARDYMTITAFIPFTGMIPGKNRKNAVMLSELCRFPTKKTVAGFTC